MKQSSLTPEYAVQLSLFSSSKPLVARIEAVKKIIHSPRTRREIDNLLASIQQNAGSLKFALAKESIKSVEARAEVREFLTMLGINTQISPSKPKTQPDLFQISIFFRSKPLLVRLDQMRRQVRSPHTRKAIDNMRVSIQEHGGALKFALARGDIKSVRAREEMGELLAMLGAD